MKKFTLISVAFIAVTASFLNAQTNSIKVNSVGQVGINLSNPAYQLDISGYVRMTSGSYSILFYGTSFHPLSGNIDCGISGKPWYRLYATTAFFTYQPVISSDEKFKTNVANLSLMKDKLKLLRPVSYNLKTDSKEIKTDEAINKLQYGFIAQELQEVFPEMVTAREDGVLGIRYSELIPVLVQAIKEQQEEIDALNERIAELEKKIK